MKKKCEGTSIILINNKREILLQLRDDSPEITYPNFWGLPGGTIELNESPYVAIIREVKEETNLDIEDINLFREFIHKNKKEFAFIGKIKDNKKWRCKEGKDLKFFNLAMINKLKIRPDDKETVMLYLKML